MSEMKHPVGDLMATALQNMRAMMDTDTVVGKPIETPDGLTLIPVSQVSLGFASGGSDFGKQPKPEVPGHFGGGAGAAVKVEPVAFLVVRGDNVRLLPVGGPPLTTADRVIDMVPEVVDKITDYLDRRKDNSIY